MTENNEEDDKYKPDSESTYEIIEFRVGKDKKKEKDKEKDKDKE